MSTEVGEFTWCYVVKGCLRADHLREALPPQQDSAYRHTLLCGHGVSLILLEMAEWKELRWKLSPGAHAFMIQGVSPARVLGAIWKPMAKGLGQARSA